MSEPLMFWIDLEATGLIASEEVVLELGLRITTFANPLRSLAEYTTLVVDHSTVDACIEADGFVTDMHSKSGLFADVNKAVLKGELNPPNKVSRDVVNWLHKYAEPGTEPLCGSSVHYDRSFLVEHMPRVNEFFHYRNIDISTVRGLAQKAGLDLIEPVQKKLHRPQPDLDDTTALYVHYRKNGVCP